MISSWFAGGNHGIFRSRDVSMKFPFMRAPGLAVAAALVGLTGLAARADEPGGHDRRLLFDPGALGQSPVALGQGGKVPALSDLAPDHPGKTPASAKASRHLGVPRLADQPLSDRLNGNLAAGLRGPLRSDLNAGADAFDSRLSVGKFSIGVETETSFKPRSPSGEEAAPAAYDPPHSGRVVPFIGLSAKSLLR